MGRVALAGWSGLGVLAMAGACRSAGAEKDAPAVSKSSPSALVSSGPVASSDTGVSRPGMAWIPPGTLHAGTPRERTPRIADEEMPGAAVEMGGFYIDLLPWPNEPNAIPTSSVTRDEAEQLCATKGKRLCSELEWERACKGPDNTTYEYGPTYRKEPCGTGVALEQASRRPTGEHAQCKSGFGVSEMHGGVWEWTSSAWGRGSKDGAQGVLRGGNSVAGELVGRCANAIARAPTKKSPTMGLRCCAGAKSAAEVKLDVQGTPAIAMTAPANATAWSSSIASALGLALSAEGSSSVDPKSLHAWSWVPIPNEELVIAMGCSVAPSTAARTCGFVIGRPSGDAGAGEVLMKTPTGRDPPEVARNGDARHLRIRSLDQRGTFSREVTYVYGRVDLGDPKRP